MAGPGLHIVLTREDAKQLFAAQGDEAIRAFVEQLTRDKQHRDQGLVLEEGPHWDPLHRVLTDGELDPEGGEFPLNHCILGGRRIYGGDDYIVRLVRPDITPYVSEALSKVKREELRSRYFELSPESYGREPTEQEFDEIWITFRLLRDFYADAADERCAVLFVAQP